MAIQKRKNNHSLEKILRDLSFDEVKIQDDDLGDRDCPKRVYVVEATKFVAINQGVVESIKRQLLSARDRVNKNILPQLYIKENDGQVLFVKIGGIIAVNSDKEHVEFTGFAFNVHGILASWGCKRPA